VMSVSSKINISPCQGHVLPSSVISLTPLLTVMPSWRQYKRVKSRNSPVIFDPAVCKAIDLGDNISFNGFSMLSLFMARAVSVYGPRFNC
jgi:hypothetical protein